MVLTVFGKNGFEVVDDLGDLIGNVAGDQLSRGGHDAQLTGGKHQAVGFDSLGIRSEGGGGLIGSDGFFHVQSFLSIESPSQHNGLFVQNGNVPLLQSDDSGTRGLTETSSYGRFEPFEALEQHVAWAGDVEPLKTRSPCAKDRALV